MMDYGIELIVGPARLVPAHVERKFGSCPDAFDPDAPPRGMTFRGHDTQPTVWIPCVPRSPTDLGTLAHEFLHVLRDALQEWAGMPLTEETDEAWAHALGMLMRESLTWLWAWPPQ